MTTTKEYSLTEAIETLATTIDPKVEIVQVKVIGPAKNPVVRVYIDYPGGVGFDVLKDTQKWVSNLLDELDPFPGKYTLEVSSPGLDRPLCKPQHFINAIGKCAKIKTDEKIEDRSSFTGVILEADENNIQVELDEGKKDNKLVVNIPFNNVLNANLKGEI